ncbi:glucosaminidase domain-containing protein [Myroides odoratus]|uniref:glucosaminidase domain-containing protein n=1 Tax=Myroides odoratus TaxID=256 RepID=UPI0007659613|nr:glucosaminidase domain-containing protein [Myroides odoratus]
MKYGTLRKNKVVLKYVYKVKDYFGKYDTPEQGFQDHALFFQKNKRYAKAWEVRGDYNRFFEEIAEAGYATSDSLQTTLKA